MKVYKPFVLSIDNPRQFPPVGLAAPKIVAIDLVFTGVVLMTSLDISYSIIVSFRSSIVKSLLPSGFTSSPSGLETAFENDISLNNAITC